MKRFVTASVLTLSLLLTTPSTATAADYKRCGDLQRAGAGVYNIRAKGVGCRKARRVARRYYNRWVDSGGDTTHRILGFRCRSRRTGIESHRARCSRDRGADVIRFVYGA
jgi:hypothetical protein